MRRVLEAYDCAASETESARVVKHMLFTASSAYFFLMFNNICLMLIALSDPAIQAKLQ